MALTKCSECGREVSDKAVSCPQCGAPVAAAQPPTAVQAPAAVQPPPPAAAAPSKPPVQKRKTHPIAWVALVLLLAGGFWIYRAATSESAAPPSAGFAAAFRQPQKLVSERFSIKEGQAMMFSFTLRSDARIEVSVQATPKNVDVMLMTARELENYKAAKGKLFGGEYSYRKALSRQGVLGLNETEVIPSGSWAIVVQRPHESLLFGDDTTASVNVTAY